MAEEQAKTKGIGFSNVRAFTIGRFGDPGWAAVVETLPKEDREELLSVIPVGWYSLALYARLIRALDKVHGRGDLALMKDLGRYEAEQDLTTIHRVFLRFANPAFIVEKTGEYWKRFHDTGTWNVTRDDHGVSAVLDGWGVVDSALCRELSSYITRVLELVGAKNVVVEHPKCRGRADPQCVFRGRWGLSEAT
jgi:predicted hydrocarbon binding protein